MIPLEKRRAKIEGQCQLFRDQGDTLNLIADCNMAIGDNSQAMEYFERSRKVGEAHGFLGIESQSCCGIGCILVKQGRFDEGMDLLRNALAAAPLAENDCSIFEAAALQSLITVMVNSPFDMDEEQRTEADQWTIRFCALTKAMTHEEPMPYNTLVFGMFSWLFRSRFLSICGDDIGAKIAIETLLSLLQDVSTPSDIYMRLPYKEQAQRTMKYITFQIHNKKLEWDDLANEFKIECRRFER